MTRATTIRTLAPILASALLGGGVAGPGAELAAQERPAPSASRGWIGISVDTRISGEGAFAEQESPYTLVVSRVLPGSPARRAGLRPGDRIAAVDGTPATPETFARLARTLRSDQRVSLTVVRDGERRSVEVVTDRRPRRVMPPLPPEVAAHLDSVREAVMKEFDSLRIRLRNGEGEEIHFTFRGDSALAFRVDPGGERVTVMRREVDAPLPPMEVRSFLPDSGGELRFRQLLGVDPAADATRRRLRTLQEELVRARFRENELRRRLRREEIREGRVDREELRELEALEARTEEVGRELQALYRRLGRREAYALGTPKPDEPRGAGPGDPGPLRRSREEVTTVRPAPPMTPHLTGRSYVAGARLQTLNPGLAAYFEVDEGVLVTEVLQGSPAAEAGLESGDVIVELAEEAVASVEALRSRLSRIGAWPVELRVIRKGSATALLLKR